ncbi:protein lplB [Paenibacillus pectinilyticus]|uniref:Protein lplB n=2 Tax=Paenibacillus pectinilyticus TaxID=512399 RepID=A0A1C1A0H7_9BACL|nr:protein lplB [Paenibacillus pectinilyticus]
MKAHTIRKPISFLQFVLRHKALYLMLLPGVVYFIIFKYVPLFGSVIAFQDYNIFSGIFHSKWVGFKWFDQFFTYPQFTRLLRNTIIISVYQLVFSFPAPIILALLLNELRQMVVKRVVQTIVYMPHFLSWVIIGGLGYMLLSPQIGLINQIVRMFDYEPIAFLQKPEYFRTIIISAGVWKEMGWNAILFLAALAGISPSLYESARIDGANRWHQLRYITMPGLLPTVMLLLLLRVGHILDVGFEEIYIFLNPISFETGDVIDTYAFREGVIHSQYSFTTAIGLFKSVIGFLFLLVANRVSRVTTGESLY